MSQPNTVFLRLDGPLQSWGVTSRFVIRDTADVPSKSGVLGLICAAMGLRREAANEWLKQPEVLALKMGVRIDRPGTKFTDYHTAGAGIGMMSAKGIIKITESTKEIETHVMRKEYLADAAFLVALWGNTGTVADIVKAIQEPVWPAFLGRKSCPPSVPVFAGTDNHDGLEAALRSLPWRPRLDVVDLPQGKQRPDKINLRAVVEVSPPAGQPVRDVPVSWTHWSHGIRWVKAVPLDGVRVDDEQFSEPPKRDGRPATEYRGWKRSNTPAGQVPRREQRLAHDSWRCVFCKQPAVDVHHASYERVGHEDIENDLRSVCRVCHDAITLLEYAAGMGSVRIDPCDPKNHPAITAQRTSILKHRDRLRRKRALRTDEEDN